MFTAASDRQRAMWASTPRSSRWLTTTLVRLPEMSTSTPSMRRMAAAPPPTLTPRTSILSPSASTMRMSTVLGCSTPAASAWASVARGERELEPRSLRQEERVADAQIVRLQSQKARHQGLVGAVPGAGVRERAVQRDVGVRGSGREQAPRHPGDA